MQLRQQQEDSFLPQGVPSCQGQLKLAGREQTVLCQGRVVLCMMFAAISVVPEQLLHRPAADAVRAYDRI